MTNRAVCNAIAIEMGGYNGELDLALAGEELALDLEREPGIDMDEESTVESIVALRSACAVPLFV